MITNYTEIEPLQAADGAWIRELAGRSSGVTSHSIAEIRHPAGTASRAHWHRELEEVYVVTAGEGWLTVDGTRQPVGPGDIVVIRPRTVHRIEAVTDLVMTVTCAPGYRLEDVVWLDSE
jgi:mannose-6-phosphate isomerase-like protein (cupin superfamily)